MHDLELNYNHLYCLVIVTCQWVCETLHDFGDLPHVDIIFKQIKFNFPGNLCFTQFHRYEPLLHSQINPTRPGWVGTEKIIKFLDQSQEIRKIETISMFLKPKLSQKVINVKKCTTSSLVRLSQKFSCFHRQASHTQRNLLRNLNIK